MTTPAIDAHSALVAHDQAAVTSSATQRHALGQIAAMKLSTTAYETWELARL